MPPNPPDPAAPGSAAGSASGSAGSASHPVRAAAPDAQQALVEELATLRDAWTRLALTLHDLHFEQEQCSRPAPLQESQEVIDRVKGAG